MPVLAHAEGLSHTYVHAAADPAMARRIVANAKMRRTGVCGATETLLIDRAIAPALLPLLVATCARSAAASAPMPARAAIVPGLPAATEADFDTEWLDAVLSIAVVDGVDAALAHIAAHGSEHTDAIVTEDAAAAERFLQRRGQRGGAVERLHPVLRRRGVRLRRRDRHRHRTHPCARAGRAGAVDHLSLPRPRHGPGAALTRAPCMARSACHAACGDRRRMRVGLLGGSFNPAHEGHRHVAELALRRLRLDQVWLLVSPGNPLKPQTGWRRSPSGWPRRGRSPTGGASWPPAIEAAFGTRYTVDTMRV